MSLFRASPRWTGGCRWWAWTLHSQRTESSVLWRVGCQERRGGHQQRQALFQIRYLILCHCRGASSLYNRGGLRCSRLRIRRSGSKSQFGDRNSKRMHGAKHPGSSSMHNTSATSEVLNRQPGIISIAFAINAVITNVYEHVAAMYAIWM